MPYSAHAPAIIIALVSSAAGLLCGFLNLQWLMRAGHAMAETGRSRAFVLSSFLRVGLFAIVAGVFAANGPWWSLLLYLVGLFVPLAFRALRAGANA